MVFWLENAYKKTDSVCSDSSEIVRFSEVEIKYCDKVKNFIFAFSVKKRLLFVPKIWGKSPPIYFCSLSFFQKNLDQLLLSQSLLSLFFPEKNILVCF